MESRPPLDPNSATLRRILVRGTNWLGDAVMTTPALQRLREKFPGSHIALLTPNKLEPLWSNHPAVNEVIAFAEGENVFAVARKLREKKFDTALVLPNSPRSALEVFLAGIPARIGHARPWRNFFLTQAVPPRPDAVKMRKRSVGEIKRLINAPIIQNSKFKIQNSANQAHEYLHLMTALGANPEPLTAKLFVTPEEIEGARKKFGLGAIAHPIFGMNPGAEYGPAKRWPVEKFIAAGKEIQRRTNCAWILFGGPNDVELVNQIQSAMSGEPSGIFNFAGRTSLRELMSLIKLCRVFLTNDTGPMHVATALGAPVVAIFGSTSPELTGPISSPEPHFSHSPSIPLPHGGEGRSARVGFMVRRRDSEIIEASQKARIKIVASDVPCSPCFLRECPIDFRCMNGIGIERVVEAVLALASR